jgi:hypothetical protein|mmetsp:Transcript_49241/g.77870  ORF Transcript_49241/g.77870 Transcript_49241/m.77870 type:complete len:232 (-) Transcript_49241:206-901(-)
MKRHGIALVLSGFILVNGHYRQLLDAPHTGTDSFGPLAALLLGFQSGLPVQRRAATVYMGRKGRPSMPGVGRQQQTTQKAPPLPADGTPTFKLYCRSNNNTKWWQVTSMPGDQVTKGFVNNWLTWPVMKQQFYDSLTDCMARSVRDQRRRLTDYAQQMYGKILATNTGEPLQWGFLVDSKQIQEYVKKGEIEKPGIVRLTDDMIKKDGFIQNMQKSAAGLQQTIMGTLKQR